MIPDLQSYVAQKVSEEDRYFAKPFSLAGAKRTLWSVACDRVWLVAFEDDAGFERWPGSGESLSQMLNYIQTKPNNPHEVEVAKLSDWIGLKPKNKELGRICGAPLSLYRVAELLKLVPSDQVTLWDASKLAWNQPCLGMQSVAFRAVLMGHDPKKVEVVEREFDLRPAEHSAFDLAMSLGSE